MERKSSQELKQILERLKTENIDTPVKLQESGIECKFLQSGIDRSVYVLPGTPWVIKFGVWGQNKAEVEAILALRKTSARVYLPGLIWFNEAKTVLVMVRYEIPGYSDEKEACQLACDLNSGLHATVGDGWFISDIHAYNVGLDLKGRPKVIDCGCFSLRTQSK